MKKRYPVDETDLFSHSHLPQSETKKFPWWKPVWSGGRFGKWSFRNHEGKLFDPVEAFNPKNAFTFDNSWRNLCKSQEYEPSSIFFVDWTKKITYYESTRQWCAWEKKFVKEFQDHRPDQIARMCDAEIAKYFEELKNGSVAQLV